MMNVIISNPCTWEGNYDNEGQIKVALALVQKLIGFNCGFLGSIV